MSELQPKVTEVLQAELAIFEDLLPQLLETDHGRFALIKNTEFYGAFDTENDAIGVGYRQYGNAPFLVRQILEYQPVLHIDYAEAA
jgi:hypothetical protein